MNVRAKFRVVRRTQDHGSPGTTIQFSAVGADDVEENRRFHKYTPSGTITMYVDNPAVEAEFQNGNVYYIDFTRAEK